MSGVFKSSATFHEPLSVLQFVICSSVGTLAQALGLYGIVGHMETFLLKGEFIELDKLLKATGIAGTGGTAHALSDEGLVSVDGVVDLRRRMKIRPGMVVTVQGRTVTVVEK